MAGAHAARVDLSVRRRRLLFRCWHRGTREMDLIMGRFAEAELGSLDGAEIEALERLIELPDGDLFAWIVGKVAVPFEHETPLFRRLLAFHAGRKSAS